MSLIGHPIVGGASGAGAGGFYTQSIDQSLRFNDDDTAYLRRTGTADGNRQTWTLSMWMKRSTLGTKYIFDGKTAAADAGTISNTYVDFLNDYFYFANITSSGGGDRGELRWNASNLLRDPSAWYHLVFKFDSTDATAVNRFRIYVNGVDIGDPDTINTYIPLNAYSALAWQDGTITLGASYTNAYPHDGYMAEVHFIDGTALDASSFGETKSGVWIPKAYSGSYGTCGFHLDFGNSGSIGADVSGNGNNFTANNLAASDVVLDSPTNNFCTLNRLDSISYLQTLEGNLKWYNASGYYNGRASFGMSTGKWYCEFILVSRSNQTRTGGGLIASNDSNATWLGNTPNSYYKADAGRVYYEQTYTSITTTYGIGDVIGMAFDADNRTIKWYKNGTALTADDRTVNALTSGQYHFGWHAYTSTDIGVFNFGQDSSFAGNKTRQNNSDDNGYGDFYYTPPSGYLALCTANLEVPDAVNPALDASPQDYFNTVLYTGNGSTNAITGMGFAPDLSWFKVRSAASTHHLLDTLRGTYSLLSSATNAEADRSGDGFTSLDSDGFTLNGGGTGGGFNVSGSSYVSWNWKANGSGVSNSDGSVTSTVSANQDAGFSIATYTGTGSNLTVGHGLSEAPDMVIIKGRDFADHWWVGHNNIGSGWTGSDYLGLNLSQSYGFDGNRSTWTGAPTSTVVKIGTDNIINRNGNDFVMYSFHSVEGFSKFNSYTGNGSNDGPFVYTGFRPAFVMIKRTDSSGDWFMWDDKRLGYNGGQSRLKPNSTTTEYKANLIDMYSNGFKHRISDAGINLNGSTYIYMAFAENPFKYATAR